MLDEQRSVAEDLLARGVDWGTFFQRAAAWEVEPVVMSNLLSAFATTIPQRALEETIRRERDSRAMALSRTLVLVDLVEKMSLAGLETLVLKGPAISQLAYGGESFRTFADIDLLLTRSDLERGRDLLLSLGYERVYDPAHEKRLITDQHALEFSRPGMKVELHWCLLSRHLRLHIDPAELWSEAVEIECVGRTIRVLAPHQLYFFLCAHGAKHEWDRVRWVCDLFQIERILSEGQVNSVIDLSERLHARRILAVGAGLVKEVFQSGYSRLPAGRLLDDRKTVSIIRSIRNSLLQTLSPSEPRDTLAARLDSRLGPLIFWTTLRERRSDQIASLTRVFFFPTENDSGPRGTRWVRRPFRLARTAVKNLRRQTVTESGKAHVQH
jgi:hypothetical protein